MINTSDTSPQLEKIWSPPQAPPNPDPSKLVIWGPQSYDEMLIGYLEVFTANKSKQ